MLKNGASHFNEYFNPLLGINIHITCSWLLNIPHNRKLSSGTFSTMNTPLYFWISPDIWEPYLMEYAHGFVILYFALGSLLLTWIEFNLGINKYCHYMSSKLLIVSQTSTVTRSSCTLWWMQYFTHRLPPTHPLQSLPHVTLYWLVDSHDSLTCVGKISITVDKSILYDYWLILGPHCLNQFQKFTKDLLNTLGDCFCWIYLTESSNWKQLLKMKYSH